MRIVQTKSVTSALMLLSFFLSLSSCKERRAASKSSKSETTSTSQDSSNKNLESAATDSSNVAPSLPGGPRGAKFYFSIANDHASFSSTQPAGTAIGAGKGTFSEGGFKAGRVYTPDGLYMGDHNKGWPEWIPNVEVGISGSGNEIFKSNLCARFNESNDVAMCVDPAFECGGPQKFFTISEFDCQQSVAPDQNGYGDKNDALFVRAVFDRTKLGANENILAVIEYSASNYKFSTTQQNCFLNNSPNPEACADFTWNAYLRAKDATKPNPFQLFVPPVQSAFTQSDLEPSVSIGSKQIILPLSSNSNLNVFQLSRKITTSGARKTDIKEKCGKSNSPLCSGFIIYSITFYRI